MTSIKDILGCSRCGCLILPDATKCPKCGTFYDGSEVNGTEGRIEPVDYAIKPRLGNYDVEMLAAHYQFSCPQHGKINVKSAIIAPKVKCPFC